MSWTLTTSGSAIATAGTNVNVTIVADGASLEVWSEQAESYCCDIARYDVVANYTSLTAQGKQILGAICDAIIAQKIIGYEPESIGNETAALRLNLMQTIKQENISLLDNDKIKTYLSIT